MTCLHVQRHAHTLTHTHTHAHAHAMHSYTMCICTDNLEPNVMVIFPDPKEENKP